MTTLHVMTTLHMVRRSGWTQEVMRLKDMAIRMCCEESTHHRVQNPTVKHRLKSMTLHEVNNVFFIDKVSEESHPSKRKDNFSILIW